MKKKHDNMHQDHKRNHEKQEDLSELNDDVMNGEEQPTGNAENEKSNNGNSEDLQKLEEQLAEQKDKYVRLFAEFDNYKRRTSKEYVELRETAGKEIIISLLDVLDDMDRAEKQVKENTQETIPAEGVLLIFDKFRKILLSKGLKEIETLHTDFDVEKDEAVTELPVDDEKLKGKVVAELQKGYLLKDKLIRYAKVVVGK